nr:proteasome accessory factor PafA2 family protein [Propionibacterium sp.]
MVLIGTETEYGILAPGRPDADPEWLAERVVVAHDGAGTPVYGGVFNRVLGNGARLYVDHGHPEYATPETTNATAATIHDLAGDAIVARAAARASDATGVRIRLFKNNTDGQGHSYGHHENHLVPRSLPWDRLAAVLPTFLVTRVVFAGAGRVGLGVRGETPGFQLSQRADFFERTSGLDTTRERGILNTRDEPHATPSRWRRLHTIAGDANRNPFATWLRLGTLALLLDALASASPRVGAALGAVDALRDPVAAFRAVSRDPTLRRRLPTGAGAASALDLQRRFLDACAAHVAEASFPEGAEIVAEWAGVLDDLGRDPAATADRLDWPAKLTLLERLRERDGLSWADPRLARLDLAWAELDAPASPFAALKRAGALIDWIPAAAVAAATREPPADTRAHARGRLVATHPDAVVAATWDSVLIRDPRGGLHNLRMTEPLTWRAGEFDPVAPWAPPSDAAGRLGLRE